MNMMIAKHMPIHYEAGPNVCKRAISAWLHVVAILIQDWKSKQSHWWYLPNQEALHTDKKLFWHFSCSVLQEKGKTRLWIWWLERYVDTLGTRPPPGYEASAYVKQSATTISATTISALQVTSPAESESHMTRNKFDQWSLPSVENSRHLSLTKGSDKSSRPHDGHDWEGDRRGSLPIILSQGCNATWESCSCWMRKLFCGGFQIKEMSCDRWYEEPSNLDSTRKMGPLAQSD